jgi:dihydropteroate synthase
LLLSGASIWTGRTTAKSWKVGDWALGEQQAAIMGILNRTPDSFFDGGQYQNLDQCLLRAIAMIEAGAFIIDVGGESSRPGAVSISASEEMDRVIPVIKALNNLKKSKKFLISIDTVKAVVAEAALNAGAEIINDISALDADPLMADLVAKSGVSVVLNHMRGTPLNMQGSPIYQDVTAEVMAELSSKALILVQMGVDPEKICLDPGIGFGKRPQDNFELIRNIQKMTLLGYPVLLGMSRKSYIGHVKGLENSDRLIPSVVSAVIADLAGAAVVRVHDVTETKEAFNLIHGLRDV